MLKDQWPFHAKQLFGRMDKGFAFRANEDELVFQKTIQGLSKRDKSRVLVFVTAKKVNEYLGLEA